MARLITQYTALNAPDFRIRLPFDFRDLTQQNFGSVRPDQEVNQLGMPFIDAAENRAGSKVLPLQDLWRRVGSVLAEARHDEEKHFAIRAGCVLPAIEEE